MLGSATLAIAKLLPNNEAPRLGLMSEFNSEEVLSTVTVVSV